MRRQCESHVAPQSQNGQAHVDLQVVLVDCDIFLGRLRVGVRSEVYFEGRSLVSVCNCDGLLLRTEGRAPPHRQPHALGSEDEGKRLPSMSLSSVWPS